MTIHFQDVLSDSNNTELVDHTPDIGTSWVRQREAVPLSNPVFRIKTNLSCKGEKNASIAHYANVSGGLPVSDYIVTTEIILDPNTLATETMAVMARASDGSSGNQINGYAACLFTTTSNRKRGILKWNDANTSSPTILWSEDWNVYDDTYRTIAIAVEGTTITMFMSDDADVGVDKLRFVNRVTDSDISGAGAGGIMWERDNSNTNLRFRGGGNGVVPFTVEDLPVRQHQDRLGDHRRLLAAMNKKLARRRQRHALWR